MSNDFGARTPGRIWQLLIRICHKPHGPLISRMVAPIARKAVVKRPSILPVDVCVDGIKLRCGFTDNYSEKKFVFTPWRYDKRERDFLAKELEKGGVFIDIGANVGLYTLTAAKAMAGRDGRIIAFEPNPETFARLDFNLRANIPGPDSKPEVKLLNIGVADRETTFTLEIDGSNLGASSMARRTRSKIKSDRGERKTVQINCRPLLDVLQELLVNSVNALKIDIEGAEDIALMPFFKQAPDSLLPRVLLVENSEHLWEQDLFGMIEKRGYKRLFQNRLNTLFLLR